MEELDIQFVDQLPAAPASQLDIAFIDQPAARAATGVVDAFEAGLEGSSAGLAYRGKLPDIGLDPANATFFQKIAAQAGGVVGDLPAMFAGAVAGGVAGGAAGSAVPVVGNAFGAVMGAGAGAMGVPTAIRESLVQSYQNGEIKGVADFLNRTSIVLKETGKDALIGALTGYAGKRALMGAEAMGLGAPGTVAAVLAAETGALTTAPAALEGRLPEWDDFANAAVMVVGLRAATTAGGAAVKTVSRGISNIYARTGVTPAEVALHSNLDPQIKADLGVPDMATPEIVAWKDRSAKSLAVDGVTTSNDLAARIRDDLGPDHFVTRVLEKLEPRLKGYKVEVLPDSEWKFRGYSETRQAQADPKKMVLQFRDSVKLEPAVHEIIHEATQAELIVNPAFTQDITAIMGRVRGEIEAGTVAGASKADMKSVKKALKNPAEFVAYGLSSPGTINVLRGVRGAGQSPTMFTTFVRTVAQAFGFKPQEYSAIHDLIHAVDVGVETSPEFKGGTVKEFIRGQKSKTQATEVVGAVEAAPPEMMAAAEAPPPAEAPPVAEPAAEAPPREIPRAYEKMAQDENTREAIQFSEKAQQAAAHPFIEVKKIPGEPTKPYELNYNRINTTDDVNSILAVTSKVYENEIIAQRRGGTVSWEQTEAEAGDYLRQLLGADTVPVRQPGTPAGAAELLARRDMVVGAAEDNRRRAEEFATLENPTIEQTAEFLASFDRLASIQAQFLGARAEAGRALNILRNTRSIGDRAEQIGQLIKEFGDDPQKLALMVLALESPEQAAKFAREKAQATTWQKVVEAYRAGLISGPFSQIQNIAGNLFMIPVRPLVDAAAAGIGRVTPGEQTVYAREALARVLGNLHGVADGARQAKVALLTGDAQANALENKRNAIEGRLGETIRLPFRGLAAGDALIRTMVERGEAYALAARQAIKEGYDPATREFRDRYIQIATNGLTAEMQLAITEAGNRGSFNMPLGSMGRAAQNMIRAWKLEWAVPFVQTPANVAKEVLRLTPAAPLVDTWRADFAKGGAARDKAVAELMVGSGIGAVAFSAAAAGYITGGGDPDPQKRASKMASGWQPYSIKYNGQYYSFRRLAPIGTVIGLYADMFEVWDHMDEGERDQVPKIAAMAVSNAITSQTFLQGLTLLLNAVTAPDQKMGTFLQGLAGSVVPGLVSQTNQVLDPYQRQINSMLDAVKARIPGVSESLPPKRDMFGEPISTTRRALGVTPVTVTTESDDKVRLEAARLGIGVAKTPNSIQMPAKGDRKLGKVELSPQQKDVFAETKGKLAHQMLTPYVNSPTWDLMPDMQQEMIYKKVFEIANEYASKKAVSQDQRQTKAQQIHDELIRRMAPKQPSILSEGLP